MFSLAMFGGNKIDGGDLEPGERATGLALFGGLEFDFTQSTAPFVDLVVIAVFGGAVVKVLPHQSVRMTGFSLFGGRTVETRSVPPPDGTTQPSAVADARSDADEGFPLEISAYAVFGGVSIKRAWPPSASPFPISAGS
jgi:hypothetical protein